ASGSEYETHAIPQNSPFNYGKAVGLLHSAASGFTAKNSCRLLDTHALIWQPLHALEEHFAEHTSTLDYLRSLASQLTKQIETLDAAGLTSLFIHGDLTGGNGNQNATGSYMLFDFDCCGLGWQAYELAVFLWSLLQNNKAHLWSAFLDGYRSATILNNNDEQAIGLFVAARSFWIMGYSLSRIAVLGSHSYRYVHFARDVEFIKQLKQALPNNMYIDWIYGN
ncbi:MAG TPA: phosphotransferase, partial [Marinagarivorans sp.]|nr:phosphotransferase [Marinagarivorans sp.]